MTAGKKNLFMRNTPSILILNPNCILWLNKILPPVLTLSTDNKRHLDFSLSKEPDGWTYLYGTIAIQICGCKKDKRRKKSMRKDFCWLYWQIHCFFIHFKLSPKTVPENRIYLWYYWPTTCDWQVISQSGCNLTVKCAPRYHVWFRKTKMATKENIWSYGWCHCSSVHPKQFTALNIFV